MAFPTGWTLLAKYKVNAAKVAGSTDFTNQPVLLKDDDFITAVYDNVDNGGGDLRFSSDEAGTTQLPCEVVSFNTSTDTAQVWVKATLDADADTYIYIWGANTGQTQPAVTDTYGRNAVWADNYKGVWHFEANGNDSSGTGNNLTGVGTPTYATGIAGNGFNAEKDSSQYFTISHASQVGLSTTGVMTVLSTYKPESQTDSACLVHKHKQVSGDWRGYLLQTYNGRYREELLDLTGGDSAIDVNVGLTNDTWNLFGVTYDGSQVRGYFNNSLIGTDNRTGTHSDSGDAFNIGAYHTSARTDTFADGIIDETWFIGAARTTDWWTTMYNMLLDHDNFGVGEGMSSIKNFLGVVQSSLKSVAGIASASIKKIAGVSNA